jgi:cellulose synthase/poly-beta-1,6-N-acetylglucosamine synthase-like glycosyltransferase
MIAETVAAGLAWFTVAAAALAFALLAATLRLIGLHLAHRRRALAAEAEALDRPLPRESELPHVVVQLPVFNEGELVRRGARAVAALDWPRDRLHVQILDDSTDGTPAISRATAAELAAAGIDAVVLQREKRTDFKAGALREGMERSAHAYFAIFDADYVPPPDFLRRCMAVLLAQPELAFVQARFDFLNPGRNAFTRAQTVMLDTHLGIEQATRCWTGHPLPFNGTCGIWRRAAIEAAGGWRGDSLAEDLDLSYRAWLKGWRGRFLVSVSAPGELPESLGTWAAQQRRWTKGFGQVARRMLPVLLAARGLGLRARLRAFFHLFGWWGLPLSYAATLAGLAAMVLDRSWVPTIGALLLALIVAGHATMFAFLRLGNRFIRGQVCRGEEWGLGRFLAIYARISVVSVFAALINLRAYAEAMIGTKTAFVRTPKRGAAGPG